MFTYKLRDITLENVVMHKISYKELKKKMTKRQKADEVEPGETINQKQIEKSVLPVIQTENHETLRCEGIILTVTKRSLCSEKKESHIMGQVVRFAGKMCYNISLQILKK